MRQFVRNVVIVFRQDVFLQVYLVVGIAALLLFVRPIRLFFMISAVQTILFWRMMVDIAFGDHGALATIIIFELLKIIGFVALGYEIVDYIPTSKK